MQNVVHVVRGDRGNTEFARDLELVFERDGLIRQTVVLQLHVVSVPEQVLIPLGDLFRFLVRIRGSAPVDERARDFARKTAAQADKAFAVLR